MSIIVTIIAGMGLTFLIIAGLFFGIIAFGLLVSNTYVQIAVGLILIAMFAYYFAIYVF